jgi:hypothetical protein
MDKGNFNTIPCFDANSVRYLKDGYDAITVIEKWEDLANYEGPFAYGLCPLHEEICKNMKYLKEHSGTSLCWVMNNMRYIAKHGWEEFVNYHR